MWSVALSILFLILNLYLTLGEDDLVRILLRYLVWLLEWWDITKWWKKVSWYFSRFDSEPNVTNGQMDRKNSRSIWRTLQWDSRGTVTNETRFSVLHLSSFLDYVTVYPCRVKVLGLVYDFAIMLRVICDSYSRDDTLFYVVRPSIDLASATCILRTNALITLFTRCGRLHCHNAVVLDH